MTGEGEDKKSPTGSPDGAGARAGSIDAFVSYASQDVAVANSVVHDLERDGLRCWIAPRDVVPGALYADGIARAINGAKVFVLVLSEHAVASPHVGKEIERASSKRRPIIALHIDSAPLTPGFEYFLSESQWIDARPGNIEAAVAKLIEGIRRHLGDSVAIETHIPAPTLAPTRDTAVPRPRRLVAGGIAAVVLALLTYFVVGHFWQSKDATAPLSHMDKAVPGVEAAKINVPSSAPAATSIAVLAFSDLSAEGNQAYFSDGIAEEILNLLAHVKGLKVASRTSSFQFRKTDIGAPAIAQKLGVRHILEGSVRKAGDTVRITAQLIDATNDQHEWSQTFDRPLSTANLFAIQDEIAKNIVDHLAAMMGNAGDVVPPTARKADTASEPAYDLYLKGRALFVARTQANLIEAARVLDAAVAKDPKFARAWEMLGTVLVTWRSWNLGDESDTQAGAAALETALRLDPNLSMAYAARGEFLVYSVPTRGAAGWEESSKSYSRAIELDGTNATAYAWLGSNDAGLGYLDRAVQEYQRCLDIDPAYELCRRKIAALYLYLGRTDEGLRLYELGLENGYRVNDVPFVPALIARGDRFGALSILAGVYEQDRQLIRPLYRALTDPTFNAVDRQEALMLAEKGHNSQVWIPSALWMLKAYEKIVATEEEPPIWWAREDPVWLKSDQRKRVMQYWHLPEYWRQHGFPPQCRPIGNSDFECR